MSDELDFSDLPTNRSNSIADLARDENPDQYAEKIKKSQQTGVPIEAVDLNLDNLPTIRTPGVQKYMLDYNNAAVSHDDISVLQGIEEAMTGFQTTAFASVEQSIEGVKMSFADKAFDDFVAETFKDDQRQTRRGLRSPRFRTPEQQEWIESAREEFIKPEINKIKELQNVKDMFTPDDLNIYQKGLRSAFDSMALNSPGLIASIATGTPAPMLAVMSGQVYGTNYSEARADGKTPSEAHGFALRGATIEAATEMLPASTLIKIFGESTGQLGKKTLKFAIQEMGTEQLATIGESINGYYSDMDEQLANVKTIDEMIAIQMERQAITAIASVVTGGTMGGAAAGTRGIANVLTASNEMLVNKSQAQKQKIDTLMEKSAESKTRQRIDTQFEKFMQDTNPDSKVYIDAEKIREYMNEFGDDPVLSIIAENMNDDDSDVSVPLSKFMSTIAPTKHGEALAEYLALDPETPSIARVEQEQSQIKDRVKSLLDQAVANEEQHEQAKEVFERVKGQLLDTGVVREEVAKSAAKIVPAYMTVFAEENGITVEEAYTRSGLVIEGPQTGERARVQERENKLAEQQANKRLEQEPTDRRQFEAEVVTDRRGEDRRKDTGRRERLAAMTPDELYKEIYLNELSGVPNRRAFNEDLETAELVASIDIDSLGQINDNLGQDAGDDFLVTVANALYDEFGEDLYHISGDEFYVLGGEQSDVEARFDKVREVLKDKSVESNKGSVKGFNFTAGFGTSKKQADDNMKAEKKVREADGRRTPKTEKPAGMVLKQVLNQSQNFVAHNLSVANLLSAAELGGLAAPSLAVSNTDVGFDSFGEITLLGTPDLALNNKAKLFDTDIYSPRQPRATNQINDKKFNKIVESLEGPSELKDPQINDARSDLASLGRSEKVQYNFLKSLGVDINIPKKKVSVEWADGVEFKSNDPQTLMNDPEFIEVAKTELMNIAEESAKDVSRPIRKKMADDDMAEALNPSQNTLFNMANEYAQSQQPAQVDRFKMRSNIAEALRGRDQAYNEYVNELFSPAVKGKRLDLGFDYDGNRKSKPYNLKNVVTEMTRELQGGEGHNYGAGSVRSTYARQLKTIEDIKAANDRIVDEATFEKVKDEANEVLEKAFEELQPFYKFDASGFNYSNDASSAIMEGPKGLAEAFEVTPEVTRIVTNLTSYLRELPTQYFEAKVQRAVSFSEFNKAIVPEGTSEKALKILKDAGVEIVTYAEGQRNEVIKQQDDVLFQESRGYYDPSQSMIRLTEASDTSTFLHEFAHFMYDTELKNDTKKVEQVEKWFIDNQDLVNKEMADNNYDELTAKHEIFARSFETYIMEGKSPTKDLREVFANLARWLVEIYKSISGDLNVRVNDELRAIFDGLLSTGNAVQLAESRAEIKPLFTDATMAGMTDQEYNEYQEQQKKVKDKANETVLEKAIAQVTRTTKRWWNEEKSEEIENAKNDLLNSGVHKARNDLRTGSLKLPASWVRTNYGENGKIPRKLSGMTGPDIDSLDPDVLAATFDYTSADEMMVDLINSPPLSEAAELKAEQVMIERHGDIFNDGTIEQLASDALLNEEYGKRLNTELAALGKKNKSKPLKSQIVKENAIERVNGMSYRDLQPAKYRKAEIKFARLAGEAIGKGDTRAAEDAKTKQLINFHMAREAQNAKNEIERKSKQMTKYNEKKTRERIIKADEEAMGQIDKILARFEFRPSATLRSVSEKNASINEFVNRMIEAGNNMQITPAVMNELRISHWKDVPYEELLGVVNSVKNIEHTAIYADKIRIKDEEFDFKETMSRWVTHIEEQPQVKVPTATDTVNADSTGNAVEWAVAQLTKVPWLASWLDGGQRVGLSHDILMTGVNQAEFDKNELNKKHGAKIMSMIENRSKDQIRRHTTTYHIPELVSDVNPTGNLQGQQILAMALNTGNKSNLKKLLVGEKMMSEDQEADFNNPKLQAALSKLTKEDWDLVQAILDEMDQLFPMIAEIHRKSTGQTLTKIKAEPIVTEFGTYKGGYFPLKRDPFRDNRAADQKEKADAQAESMFGPMFNMNQSVNTGVVNERVEVYYPIHLNLNVVMQHFDETIHYITHHEPVRQLNRVLNNKSVRKAIETRFGRHEFKNLKNWLNAIAKDGRKNEPNGYIESAIQRLRFGTTLGVMGFKASTGLMQLLGSTNSIAEIGPKHFYRGVRQMFTDYDGIAEMRDFAYSRSKSLEARVISMDREMKSAMAKLQGKRGVIAAVQEASMKHIAYIQLYTVDLPAWFGAYNKKLEETGDEVKAAAYGDWVIENIQGSGATKDLANIMQGSSELRKAMTMFMTFFSSFGNQQRDFGRGIMKGDITPTTAAGMVMMMYVLPVILESLLRGEIDLEDEEMAEKLATKMALYPTAVVPFFRDVASAGIGEYGYNASPVFSILEQGLAGAKGMSDGEITKSEIKRASKLAGAALGIPGTSQLWSTGESLYAIVEKGEEQTITELLVTGPKKDK